MCKRYKRLCQVLHIFISLVPIICGSCSRAKPSESYIYPLRRGAYLPTKNKLLFVSEGYLGGVGSIVLLGMYDEDRRGVKYLLTSVSPAPFDLACSPKRDIFAITHGDRISLFQKDAEYPDGYTGMSIGCPLGFYYSFCAWSPKGDWLAVNCKDMRKPSLPHRLGLYRFSTKKFIISNVHIGYSPPFWKDDTTLCVPDKNNVHEVSIDSGVPKIVHTLPIEKDASWVYGIFGGEVLIQKDSKLKLGTRILIELEQDTAGAVITTEELISVVASPNSLVVFDHQGNELSRTNPGREIRFGSVCKDPNTVYGLAGSTLLRVRLESGNLSIQEVCDLADF